MAVDRNGTPIALRDVVTLEEVSQGLLRGLPPEDQLAIKQQVGKTLEIVGFNDQGYPELEFVDQSGVYHTIWVENTCVVKRKNG
jgi:hypothetical protein